MSEEEEEKVRAEAVRRMERRKKKLQEQSGERLARITGQPVLPGPINLSPSRVAGEPAGNLLSCELLASGAVAQGNGGGGPLSPASLFSPGAGEDPPLENLIRTTFLGEGLNGSAGMAAPPPSSPPLPQVPDSAFCLLALCSFAVLQSPYAFILSHSCLLPFLLCFSSLVLFGFICAAPSSFSSILSAALMLCGLNPLIVSLLIKTLEILRKGGGCFSVYMLTIISSHEIYSRIQ